VNNDLSVSISRLFVNAGILTTEQAAAALTEAAKSGVSFTRVLAALGYGTEEQFLKRLAEESGLDYLNIRDIAVPSAAIERMPVSFVSHYRMMPVGYDEGVLTVAVADPSDIAAFDDVRSLLNMNVVRVLASASDIAESISRYYGVGAEALTRMKQDFSLPQVRQAAKAAAAVEETAEAASIITLVNQIISEAVRQDATDVHLEPLDEGLRARYRIDGVLQDVGLPAAIASLYPSIVSRIKIMANLNIAEQRLPQDGRIRTIQDGRELDIRVSTMPLVTGEAVHLRLLRQHFFLGLEQLGYLPRDLKVLEDAIARPHGIILVTGPTGNGKSTTLYACLAKINDPGRKIITVEDPVEYRLNGVNQIQVQPRIGLTFAEGLRHILRHDPDVLMVGEIRDSETAEISIRAALTGHLVLSTLHTNDAAGTITRLLDMGFEPFLLSSTLTCLVAQRLIRRLCPQCRKAVTPDSVVADQLRRLRPQGDITVYEAQGCKACRGTGYRGRSGIFEIVIISDGIRELILNRASSQEIRRQATKEGMRTLLDDGLEKVLMGVTSIAEVLRVTQEE
jgi:type II secretory ATPase GspE/PulE/Tfp pilus assembly ATPase PilB-like protein